VSFSLRVAGFRLIVAACGAMLEPMAHVPPLKDGKRLYGHFHPCAEDKARCIASISDGPRTGEWHQCHRPRGFGPDGAYCKQHTPASDADKRTVWVCSRRHGCEIATATLIKESAILWWFSGGDRITNYRSKVSKSEPTLAVFNTELEAAKHAIKWLQDNKERCQRDLEHATNELIEMQARAHFIEHPHKG
jgi:hypothetical protein